MFYMLFLSLKLDFASEETKKQAHLSISLV